MGTVLKCCLCCIASKQYKQLKNRFGVSNEIYDITIKYFDPTLLNINTNALVGTILCEDCWRYINDFNEFQIRVLETRSLLLDTGVTSLPKKTEEVLLPFQLISEVKGETSDVYKKYTTDAGGLPFNDIDTQTNSNKITEEATKIVESGNSDNYEKNNLSILLQQTNQDLTQQKANVDEKDNKKYTLVKGKEIDQFIAQWNPQLECDLCPATAPSFDTLRSHFQREHKTRFYIKCCDRKFYRRCILFDHIRLHVNPEIHKCDVCAKISSSKYNLMLHKKLVHTDNRDYECSICQKNFNHKPSLDRHFLTHATGDKKYSCEVCGKAYIKQVQLNTHIRNVHNVSGICDQCGKTFYNLGSLKQHLIQHSSLPKTKFTCESCGVQLKSKEAIKRHKAAYHHDGSTVYVCSTCGKVSASQNALISHKKFVHENKRKHKCIYCNKAFRTSTVLREHTATHTGEDLYQCPHCPQSFKTNANMHHHRKRMHPIEWIETRNNRVNLPKISLENSRTQVIL